MAIILYLCEFAADKIPAFDSVWDSVHTLIRPFGAALISMTVVGDAAPPVEVISALLGASLAMSTHAAKAGTRLVVNTSPEPFSNIAVSLGEDVGVIGMSVLVMSHPYIALVISLVTLILLVTYGPGLWRGAFLVFRSIPIKIASVFGGAREVVLKEALPDNIEEAVDEEISKGEEIQVSLKCFAQKIKGCGRNRKGYLILTQDRLFFGFRRLFRTGLKKWKIQELEKTTLQKKFLMDVLRIKSEGKFLRLMFLKNNSDAAKRLSDTLDGMLSDTEQQKPAVGETSASLR